MSERVRNLMMAALDGEITPAEREELDRALAADPAAMEEWNAMSRVKQTTSGMAYREPPEEVWRRFWSSTYNRVERGVGWVLVSVGAIGVGSFWVWRVVSALLGDTDVPLLLKLALAAVGVGGLVLFVSVAREKLFTWKRDPYRRIER